MEKMNRRQFIKSVFGVLTGLAVVPGVVKAKEPEFRSPLSLIYEQAIKDGKATIYLVEWGQEGVFSIYDLN